MSSLFKAKILPDSDESIKIILESTNHEDQILQTKPIFYFAIIGSIYWEMNENIDGYAYGFTIDQPFKIPKISNSIPMLDHYVNWGKIELGEDIDDFELYVDSPYPENVDLQKLFTITVEKESRDANGAVHGELTISSKNKELLNILKTVNEVSILFDEDYF